MTVLDLYDILVIICVNSLNKKKIYPKESEPPSMKASWIKYPGVTLCQLDILLTFFDLENLFATFVTCV